MKSRIKKLLAAALALCLIAALVPGAALAAGTTVATVPTTGNNVTTHTTLEEALEKAKENSNAESGKYKVVTLTSSCTVTQTTSVVAGVTLNAAGQNTITIADGVTFTVAGEANFGNVVIENGGKLVVENGKANFSGNVTVEAGGELTFATSSDVTVSGSIDVEGSEFTDFTAAGKLSANGLFDCNAKLTINGEANVKSGQKLGAVTVGELGKLSSDGALTIAGQSNVNGTLVVTGDLLVSNDLTVNGSVNVQKLNIQTGASVKVDSSGSLTTSSTVANGSLAVSGTYKPSGATDIKGSFTFNGSSIGYTVNVDGDMDITSDVALVNRGRLNIQNGGSLTVDGKLDEGSGTLTVNAGATATINGALVVKDGHKADAGTIRFEKGSQYSEGSDLIIGASRMDVESGSISLTNGEYTVNSGSVATINGPRFANTTNTYDMTEKITVNGTLNISYPTKFNNELGIGSSGKVVVASGVWMSIENNSRITGSGDVQVNFLFYYRSKQDADSAIDITLGSNGAVYCNNQFLNDNITNGTAANNASAPDGSTYSYYWTYSRGRTFNITPSVGSHGTANIPTSSPENETVTFNASPADGYMVDPANTYYTVGTDDEHVRIAVVGNECSFVMPSNNVTVHVGFKKAENTSTTTEGNITVVTNHNGNGTVNASINGRVVTVTVRANTNYVINTVSIAGRGQTVATDAKSGTYSYTVPGTSDATVEVYVTFKSDDFEVTLTNYTYDDGRISLSTGTTTTGRYAEGKQVTIYAFPDRDFYVRSLTITRTDNRQTVSYSESSTSDDVFYFTMPASDVTVRAYFTDGVYEIATDIDGSGRLTITGEDGNVTDVAEEGEEIRITASPSNNYRLGDLYVTYTDSDDEDQVIYPEVEYKNNGNVDYYWFEMPEYDVEIYADFGEGDYVAWIDRSDMKNGTIRVSPNVADEDDTVSIYVTPDTGYQLDELIVEDEDGHDVTTSSLASGTRYTFRMPDSDVTVTATFKSRSYSSNFTDVPRYEWYYEAVSYVASEGLMNGVSTTQFNPNGTASRAQIVTILWRLAGEPSALTGAFTDVPAGQYYSTAVAWASRQGIVTGVGNNRFEPNSNITREQLAVILYRYAQDAGYTTSASANITGYYDYARVNSYARTAMSWAVGAGLITGTSTTTLSPQDTATRAQVATILMRFCENIAK